MRRSLHRNLDRFQSKLPDREYYDRYPEIVDAGVYFVKKKEDRKEYYLDYAYPKFKEPSKVYPPLDRLTDYYKKSMKRNKFTDVGIMLTGQKGSGKTVAATLLSNFAIREGLKVVQLTKIPYSAELVEFLDSLDECVILLDEFGKNFTIKEQDLLLTMLSNVTGKCRMVFVTENMLSRVSQFIKSRPGRLRYHKHFGKIDRETIEAYCSDYDINGKFYKDFMTAYEGAINLQFDHVEALIQEHLVEPDMKFKDLVDLLNIEGLSDEVEFTAVEVKSISAPNKVYRIDTNMSMTATKIEKGFLGNIMVVEMVKPAPNNAMAGQGAFNNNDKPTEVVEEGASEPMLVDGQSAYIYFDRESIAKLLEDEIVLEKDDFRVTLKPRIKDN